MTTVRPLPQDAATQAQKSAIIGLVYRKAPSVTTHSPMSDVIEAIEHLTAITVESWENLDKRTASKIISNLIA